eukprot:TRINITY_DN2714_c0_g1_i1.p2 TRINITY_DN2714_c0_g1~~TRINITY_DN2714_c0_g1_i1.p2  ORF type:complete len:122 (+),score=18.74 TRINITY_DN2714_c0_g1_i1:144-509(+)
MDLEFIANPTKHRWKIIHMTKAHMIDTLKILCFPRNVIFVQYLLFQTFGSSQAIQKIITEPHPLWSLSKRNPLLRPCTIPPMGTKPVCARPSQHDPEKTKEIHTQQDQNDKSSKRAEILPE